MPSFVFGARVRLGAGEISAGPIADEDLAAIPDEELPAGLRRKPPGPRKEPTPPKTAAALDALAARYGADYATRPKVCFTGGGRESRDAMIEAARARGWRAVDSFQADIKVLVAEDPAGDSTKLRRARAAGIAVLSFEEFERLNPDGTMEG